MKKAIFFLVVIFVVSCQKKEAATAVASIPEPEIVDFGLCFNDFDVIQDTIAEGDNFGSIIAKQNIGLNKIHELVAKIKDSFDVRKIKFGKPYTLFRNKNKSKKLAYFVYQPDQSSYVVVDFRDSVLAYKKNRPVTFKRRTIAGELNGSLSETLKQKGVSVALSTQLIGVYKWSIDFFKSKKGDKFAITFTERFINDSIYDGVDNLEAAFFEYKGKTFYAFPFVQDTISGKIEYYDEEAKVLKNVFLKAPLKFINITSHYTKSRFHPVQQIWKAHNGTDYAAPTGTPIMTTAAGVVEQTGFSTGNGNFVKVKHQGKYATQYLHMSRILVRRGQNVNQGDIIGLVGSTGLATGPHVCYRFWVNGVQVDALKLKLPNSEPLSARYKPQFFKTMLPLKRELDSVSGYIKPKFG